jgi:hypothetical protein
MKPALEQAIRQVSELSSNEKELMFLLMADHYKDMQRETFDRDLSQKNLVLLLWAENRIQGFTTFVSNPKGCGTAQYHILFSGDTIIAPEFWGSTAMVDGWFKVVARFLASDPHKPWYWFLMSKGHRTYMYLPLFFQQYYPALEPNRQIDTLKEIANDVAFKLYPEHWRPDLGVIQFPNAAGALTAKLAAGTYDRKHNPQVAFFLKKNPNFEKGDELVCICALNPDNLRGSSREKLLDLLALSSTA